VQGGARRGERVSGHASRARRVRGAHKYNRGWLACERREAAGSGDLFARADHACCAVRGALVVLGGDTSGGEVVPSVEMLAKGEGAFSSARHHSPA